MGTHLKLIAHIREEIVPEDDGNAPQESRVDIAFRENFVDVLTMAAEGSGELGGADPALTHYLPDMFSYVH